MSLSRPKQWDTLCVHPSIEQERTSQRKGMALPPPKGSSVLVFPSMTFSTIDPDRPCTITGPAGPRWLFRGLTKTISPPYSSRSTNSLRFYSLRIFSYNTQNTKADIAFMFPLDLLTLEWTAVSFIRNFIKTPNVPLFLLYLGDLH